MERFLVEYLANSVWQTPMIAAAVWLIVKIARSAPQAQHRLWVGALILMVTLPAFTVRGGAGMKVTSAPIAAPLAATAAAPIVEAPAAVPLSFAERRGEIVEPPAAPAAPETIPIPVTVAPSVNETRRAWPAVREIKLSAAATYWLVALYLAAIALMAFRLLCSWWGARRVVTRATPAVLSGTESEMLDRCCARLGVKRPKVLVSASTCSPMVVGVIEPVLLLPEGLAGRRDELREGSEGELEAVWLHELAHVRRRDYLANLLCRVAALPVAYHPATHAVQQRIRRTREMVCDAMAAAEMQSAPSYARCLVGLAREMQAAGGMTVQIEGAGMFDGGVLEERVMQLIGTKTAVSIRMRIARAVACAAILAAVTAVAAMVHVSPMITRVVGIDAGGSDVIQAASNPITPGATPQAKAESIAGSSTPVAANAVASSATPEAATQAMGQATPVAVASPAIAATPAVTNSEETLDRILAGRRSVEQAKHRMDDALAAYNDLLATQNRAQESRAQGKPGSSDLTPQLRDAKRRVDDAQRAYNDANRAVDDLMAQTSASARASEATREFLVKQLAEAKTQLEVQSPNTDALKQEADELAKEIARQQALSSQLASVNPEMKKRLEILKGEMAETLANYAIQLRKNEELKQTIGRIQNQLMQAEQAEAQSQHPGAVNNQMADALSKLNSPHFKKQIQDIAAQLADASATTSDPRLKQIMAEIEEGLTSPQLQKNLASLNSPEFKKQMEDAQVKLNNPAYMKLMQGLYKNMQTAQKANSPEFKQQMGRLNQAMADLQAKANSPEFKKKMEKLDPEVKAEMEQMQKQLKETVKAWSSPAAK